jgi:hypothetical protein
MDSKETGNENGPFLSFHFLKVRAKLSRSAAGGPKVLPIAAGKPLASANAATSTLSSVLRLLRINRDRGRSELGWMRLMPELQKT